MREIHLLNFKYQIMYFNITKYSPEFHSEFKESIFADKGIYNDAIIGVTTDRRVVYDFYNMLELLEEYDFTIYGNYYRSEFVDKDYHMEYIYERICKTIRNLEKELPTSAPIICCDKDFLTNILPNLEDNTIAYFNHEIW